VFADVIPAHNTVSSVKADSITMTSCDTILRHGYSSFNTLLVRYSDTW